MRQIHVFGNLIVLKEALDEAALDNVAGGEKLDGCESTADSGEWCWFSDSCSLVINYYDKKATNIPEDPSIVCKEDYYLIDETTVNPEGDYEDEWEKWNKYCTAIER